MERKFSECLWCGKTIDTTNEEKELCFECSKYQSKFDMIKAQRNKLNRKIATLKKATLNN